MREPYFTVSNTVPFIVLLFYFTILYVLLFNVLFIKFVMDHCEICRKEIL